MEEFIVLNYYYIRSVEYILIISMCYSETNYGKTLCPSIARLLTLTVLLSAFPVQNQHVWPLMKKRETAINGPIKRSRYSQTNLSPAW